MDSIIYILNYNKLQWNYKYKKTALGIEDYCIYDPAWPLNYFKSSGRFLKHTLLVLRIVYGYK